MVKFFNFLRKMKINVSSGEKFLKKFDLVKFEFRNFVVTWLKKCKKSKFEIFLKNSNLGSLDTNPKMKNLIFVLFKFFRFKHYLRSKF